MANNQTQKPTKTFRINARQLFLTYPKCDIPIQDALKQLHEKIARKITGKIKEFIVVQEEHADKTKHIHAYLQLNKKINITEPKAFDLRGTDTSDVFGREKAFHGNYQGVKSQKDVISYLTKDISADLALGQVDPRKCLISEEIKLRINTEGEFLDIEETMLTLAEAGEIGTAMELYRKYKPKEYLNRMNTIERNLHKIYGKAQERRRNKFDFDTCYIPESLKRALALQDRFLWIQGQSGIGKTQAISRYLEHIGHQICRITDLEGIKEYEPKCDRLMLDDVPFTQIQGQLEKIIHHLDIHSSFTAQFKHGSITIPPIKKIALSNKHPAEVFSPEIINEPSIKRRLTYIDLGNIPLYIHHPQFKEYMSLEPEKRHRVEKRIFKTL